MRQSHKLTVPAVITAAAMLTAGCSGALAATAKTKHPWQAVAGHFKTKTAAKAEVKTLAGKGLKGYRVEKEKKGQFTGGKKYEVEKSVTSKKKAAAAVKKLTKAGVTGATIEKEKTEKA
jgi:hypothetical protein